MPETTDISGQDFIKFWMDAGLDPHLLQDIVLAEMAGRIEQAKPDWADIRILPDLYTTHNPDIVVNAIGQTIVLVDKPFPETIWWAEYDHDLAQLYFVMTGGEILPLGMPVHAAVGKHLRYGNRICLVEIDKTGKVIRTDERVLMVRQYEKHKEIEKI